MNKIRFLILLEWAMVYAYSKYGYTLEGEAGANWARFFYISLQLILCGYVWVLYRERISKAEFQIIVIYNFLLAILFAQHYILPKSYINKMIYCGAEYIYSATIIEHYPHQFYIPCMTFMVVSLLLTFFTNFRRN